MLTIAIVGRANVGKTTIFNRFVGSNTSIVANYAGTTRDRNEIETDYFGLKVKFIDLAGIELKNDKNTINKQMVKQAVIGIENSNLCLFVIDGRTGITQNDIEVFNILRVKNKDTILLVNKAEHPNKLNINENELKQFNTAKSIIFISAEHNYGFNEIFEEIKKRYVENCNEDNELQNSNKNINKNAENNKNNDNDHKISIAIIGRPNAGKSTFLNNLLSEERLITSDIEGTTRDKIKIEFSYKSNDFILFDTAGIRKKHKEGDELEKASVEKSLEALQYADVVILIMDVTKALEEQDLSLCQKVINEGRILLICFNKWDLVSKKDEEKLLQKLKEKICKSICQVKGTIFFTCSAIKDNNLPNILLTIKDVYHKWNYKISSGVLNKAVENAKIRPSVITELKIKYITQVKVRPPTFIAFSGKKEKDIKQSNVESIKNWLYKELNLFGIPIRLSIRGKIKK